MVKFELEASKKVQRRFWKEKNGKSQDKSKIDVWDEVIGLQ